MIPGDNGDFGLHCSGDLGQPGQQAVGIFCGDPELFGGEGDGGIFYFGKKIEFILDSGGAVGAVQMFNQVDFLWHDGILLKNDINI
jgi:hypothetical protein